MAKSKFDNLPCTVVLLMDADLYTINFDSFATYKKCADGAIGKYSRGKVVLWDEKSDGELPRDEDGYVLSHDELEEQGVDTFDMFNNYELENKHVVFVGAQKVLDRT